MASIVRRQHGWFNAFTDWSRSSVRSASEPASLRGVRKAMLGLREIVNGRGCACFSRNPSQRPAARRRGMDSRSDELWRSAPPSYLIPSGAKWGAPLPDEARRVA